MVSDTTAPTIRNLDAGDRPWLRQQLDQRWGGPRQARRGELVDVADLPGVVAVVDGSPTGFACWRSPGGSPGEVGGDGEPDGGVELAVIDAGPRQGAGVGTALLDAVVEAVRASGARSLWLVTTNDNLRALRFYQRRGFTLEALRPGALTEARRRKPTIPLLGHDGIAIADELELRRCL